MVLVFETSEPSSMTHLSNKAIPPNPPGTVPPEYLNMNLLGTILIQINTYTHATKENQTPKYINEVKRHGSFPFPIKSILTFLYLLSTCVRLELRWQVSVSAPHDLKQCILNASLSNSVIANSFGVSNLG